MNDDTKVIRQNQEIADFIWKEFFQFFNRRGRTENTENIKIWCSIKKCEYAKLSSTALNSKSFILFRKNRLCPICKYHLMFIANRIKNKALSKSCFGFHKDCCCQSPKNIHCTGQKFMHYSE